MRSTPKTIISGGENIPYVQVGNVHRNALQVAYLHDNYVAILVVYPINVLIRNFEKTFERIQAQENLKEKILPVYFLVSNGSMGDYFIIYLRK